MARVIARVRDLLSRRPIASNIITYGVLYGAGDLTQQSLLHPDKPTDWISVRNVAFIGAGIFGPIYPVWYRFLDARLIGTATSTVAKKIALDQGILGAIGCFIFFAGTAALDGKSKKDIANEVTTKWPKAYFIGWAYWPMIQFINFRFLPTYLRAPYVAMAAFLWTNLLCYFRLQHDVIEAEEEAVVVTTGGIPENVQCRPTKTL